jgi:hypothetical protein
MLKSLKTLPFMLLLLMLSFTVLPPHAQAYHGVIYGHKFHDLNANGVDDNEPRLAGVRILLSSRTSPSFNLERVTDNNGAFSFANLPHDRYQVCELPPIVTPPWIPTTPECLNVNLRGKNPTVHVRFGNIQQSGGGNGGELGCTRTQGYWGNSPAGQQRLIELVGSGITLGNRSYTAAELDSILDTPVSGNALINLSHQLIAAKLNVLNGANSSAVSADIALAESLIGNMVVPPVGSDYVAANSALGQQMLAVKDRLDAYNNGRLNVPGCR